MNAILLLWLGLTLILAVPPLLGELKVGGGNVVAVIGAVCMVVGCVLLLLGL